MDIQTVIARVDQILIREFELEESEVVPTATLREDLELDSLDGLDLVVALEKEFGFKVDDEVLLKTQTVGDIHSLVREIYANHVEP